MGDLGSISGYAASPSQGRWDPDSLRPALRLGDPVHSHRVPVDVAYQRGYFDEEMNRVLEVQSLIVE